MSARKSSHRTIFLIVSNGSPLALIASSLRSTSKKPVCPMTRSLDPPMAHCGQRVRFVATWREEFFEVPTIFFLIASKWRKHTAQIVYSPLDEHSNWRVVHKVDDVGDDFAIAALVGAHDFMLGVSRRWRVPPRPKRVAGRTSVEAMRAARSDSSPSCNVFGC